MMAETRGENHDTVVRKRTAKTEEVLGGLLRERIKRSSLGDNWYETGCWCYISLVERRVE